MKIIQILSERIEEELDDSFEYIEMAIRYKEEFPQVAKTFYELSIEEMRHMDMLHIEVSALIKKHREEHGEPPAAMLAVYEFLHKRDIEKAAKIKLLQNHFKEI